MNERLLFVNTYSDCVRHFHEMTLAPKGSCRSVVLHGLDEGSIQKNRKPDRSHSCWIFNAVFESTNGLPEGMCPKPACDKQEVTERRLEGEADGDL